jgi:hypothetical protein
MCGRLLDEADRRAAAVDDESDEYDASAEGVSE